MVSFIRNLLYDTSLIKSTKFNLPVIGIGNLAIGGTGKSPMTEYLINLLSNEFDIATLSRGYGRKTNTFKIATKDSTHFDIGDEPLQFYNKYDNLIIEPRKNISQKFKDILKIDSSSDSERTANFKLSIDLLLILSHDSTYKVLSVKLFNEIGIWKEMLSQELSEL